MVEENQIADQDQNQKPYIDRVYSALKDNLSGFNKTPNEFKKSMQDKDYALKAYSALKDNLSEFNKTPDEFYQSIGLKKKVSSTDQKSISPKLGTGIPTVQDLSDGSPIPYTPAYEQSHQNAIQRARNSRTSIQPKEEKKDRSILESISQGSYLPAFNEGFNELVTKPLSGANDFIDRTIDKAYKGITGQETPSWLRKGSGLDNIVKYYDEAYNERDKPSNIISDIAESTVGQLPLVASMFTGEGEASIAMKAPNLFGKATKILAITGAANAYKDATDKGDDYLKSLQKAMEGGREGAVQGLTMDAQMLLGGALGKGTVNKLVEKGLFKGGKAGESILHALATGTVFSGTDAAQDLLNGKDIDVHKSMKQFGIGLAMELPLVAKGINSEIQGKKINDNAAKIAAVSTSASNLNSESTLRTLINTDNEQLSKIKELSDSHEDLYAKSIENGVKAYNSEDINEKRNYYSNQLILKTQGDVKLIEDKIKDPEKLSQLTDAINQSEITDEQKQDLLTKLETLKLKTDESTKITPSKEEDEINGQQVAERPSDTSETKEDAQTEKNGQGDVITGAEKAPLTKGEQNAIQEQTTDEGVLRQERSELGLSQVGEGDTEQKITSEKAEEIPEEKEKGLIKEPSETQKTTGIKKAISESTRIEKGLPEIKLSKLGSGSEILSKGKKDVDEGKIIPHEVAQKIIDEKRNYSPDEAGAMLYYGHQLSQEESNLRSALSEVNAGSEDYQLIFSNLKQLDDKIELKTRSDRTASNNWGKAGYIMTIEADESFSPANISSIIKENYGGTIPKDVQIRINKAESERDKAIADLKKATENQINKQGKETVEKIRKSVGLVKMTKAELEKEAEDLKKELVKALKKDFSRVNSGIPIPTETLAVLGKLAVNYFKQGVKDFEGLANKIFDDLKDTGIDKRQLREYLSTYDPLKAESKARRFELMGRKERSLVKQLETGKIRDYSRKPDIPFKKDAEIIKAEQRIADAEYKIKQEKSKSYKSTENKYQRSLNWIIRWERRTILSNPLILVKLASAATIGSAINRIPKQLIGGAFSAVFKGIAERAHIEGGLNIRSELKFWKEFSDPQKFVNNSWEILKTGTSPLTRKLSPQTYEHFAGWDTLMDTHAIVKDPVKRATFESSLMYAYDWAAKQGYDYTDPLIKKSLESAAYKRALYEIFQEDSGMAKRVNDFINSEKQKNDEQATYKALLKFIVPISTVPLNIVRRVGSNIFGLPHGLYEIHKAYKNGIDNLKPEQADFIMRQLKNGSTGLAYYTFGLFASNAILGGLWNKDDKKGGKPIFNQAAFNEMKVGQYSVDKRIQHALPLQLTQLGATTARVYNYYMDLPTDDPKFQSVLKSTAKAMSATIGTQIEEIPMINEPKQAFEALTDPYQRKKFVEGLKRRVGFSILDDITGGEEKKEPLDKKLSTIKTKKGEEVKLAPNQILHRKKAYENAIKNNQIQWKSDFNSKWINNDKHKELIKKSIPYWKSIGRSKEYIDNKVKGIKQDELNKYIEERALKISLQYMPTANKKNNYSIKNE